MAHVLECHNDTVVVLPTGGGKSMLGIVPSLLEVNMVTVLVLPLNSLITDYKRLLTAMGVPYPKWTRGSIQETISSSFWQTSHRWPTGGQHWRTVSRIVVDEAHIQTSDPEGLSQDLAEFLQYSIRTGAAGAACSARPSPQPSCRRCLRHITYSKVPLVCRRRTN